MWFFLLIACSSLFEVPEPPADRADVGASLTGNFRNGSLNLRRFGRLDATPEASVQRVRFDLQPGFEVSAALWTPEKPTGAGIVVAHGHYGQGKSSAEAQEIAHRLAANGARVLAVDTPGVEEWDVAGRRIHFAEGAHNRAFLVAGGASALALQIDILRRGLDVLEAEGATRLGATGASGGAVQSFYLGWLDARVKTTVMASFPRIPREAAAGGCACDQIPGHAGPDPDLLGQLSSPSLWLSEVKQGRPAGLLPSAEFEVLKGPHSYTEKMQRRSIAWFAEHLGTRGDWVDTLPALDLSSGSVPADAMPITALELPGTLSWSPAPVPGEPHRSECSGKGDTILLLGADVDPAPLADAGMRICRVWPVVPPGEQYNELAWAESIGRGLTRVDALAGAVNEVARREEAIAVWGHRAWGLVAAATGVPFVVQDPVLTIDQVNPEMDPPWIHVPGAWEGSIDRALAGALKVGDEPSELVDAIRKIQE